MKAREAFVILTPGFPASESDDTCLPERQVFVRSLIKQYQDIDIIILTFHYPYTANQYKWYGAEVISFGGQNHGKFKKLNIWFQVWQTLTRLNQQKRIIGVLSFWLGECAFVGNFFSRRYHRKHFCWLLGQDAKKGNRYIQLIKPHSESLIAISDFIAEELHRNYKIRPAHIITSGIDTDLFTQQSFDREIDVLGAGSLTTLKQFDIFINIIHELNKFIPGLKAVLCGKGPLKQHLLQQIKDLHLESSITLLDEIPHKNVLQLMQKTKVFLHTSSYEGWSTVCMEALYAGAHVIAFCRPMNESMPHFHILSSKADMIKEIGAILQDQERAHTSIFPFPIQQTVKKVMDLYAR
ncbi:glycosyltransferase [Chitinophagaceae bacterium LB-8]|uniref:Glycosyltransferase n=1 Tax=Paraflavisolibacter caeni TaxID=2982496 RepID=A0A9X2XUX1_9BACT|nr:glycosyltransferase [Paraflavisolibacter caeni]MCU7548971.1 glycosyltransferase [Paraflavisolibacter caeni]